MRVSVPATMSRAEEERWVNEMLRRIGRRQQSASIDVHDRARALAGRFGLAAPKSTRWVDNQNFRWGSCTPNDGAIRISRGWRRSLPGYWTMSWCMSLRTYM